jgi:hypothetical protein
MIALPAILEIGSKLLDKFIPDPAAKAKAQLDLAQMAQNGELASMANDTKLVEMAYADDQSAHKEQQETIRSGDNSSDEYVRRTRPMMARQSWYGAAAYVFAFEGAKLFDKGTGANWEIAMMLLSVALAYHGFRSFDKSKWGRK